jgi:SpoVK/Ycf46/Vps4 family AAA+-type ATPase
MAAATRPGMHVSHPSGTGKTTVARRVGLLFESLGLLASSQLVACSASDFVTGYVNQASGKTREIFDSALGQVLFIDEAYRCAHCGASCGSDE